MERPEFNKLRRIAKSDPDLVVEEAMNRIQACLYDGGNVAAMVIISKFDIYKQAEMRLFRLLEKSKQLKENKNS